MSAFCSVGVFAVPLLASFVPGYRRQKPNEFNQIYYSRRKTLANPAGISGQLRPTPVRHRRDVRIASRRDSIAKSAMALALPEG
jgi:hypothetical protein